MTIVAAAHPHASAVPSTLFICHLIWTCGMILQANVLIAVDEYNEFYQPSGWFWGEEERRISPQEFPILEVCRYNVFMHTLPFINLVTIIRRDGCITSTLA